MNERHDAPGRDEKDDKFQYAFCNRNSPGGFRLRCGRTMRVTESGVSFLRFSCQGLNERKCKCVPIRVQLINKSGEQKGPGTKRGRPELAVEQITHLPV